MISLIHFLPRGRLAEYPTQYELAPEELEQLVAEHEQLQLDGKLQTHDDEIEDDDEGKATQEAEDEAEDEDDDEADQAEAMDRLRALVPEVADTQNEGDEEGGRRTKDKKKSKTSAGAVVAEEEEEDVEEIEKSMEDENDEDDDEEEAERPPLPAHSNDPLEEALLRELSMDKYEEEEEGAALFLGGQKLTVYASNSEDPYLNHPSSTSTTTSAQSALIDREEEEEEEEEAESNRILPTDHVFVVGKTMAENSAMEVFIFDSTTGNLFIHHDFQLPSFPLCAAWLDLDPRPSSSVLSAADAASHHSNSNSNSTGNFLAIGTFLPQIEIWNLDVMDALEPVAILGGFKGELTGADAEDDEALRGGRHVRGDQQHKKTKQKMRKKKSSIPSLKSGSHTEAVLSLAWHPAHRQRLASGSADETVKLWDVSTGQCVRTLEHHHHRVAAAAVLATKSDKKKSTEEKKRKKKSQKLNPMQDEGEEEADESWFEEAALLNSSHKVQSLDWNPFEPSLLLTGAYDRTVHLVDVRVQSSSSASSSMSASAASTASSRVYRVDSDVEQVRWHPHASSSYLFLVATESGLVSAFDARRNQQPLFRLQAHDGACTSVGFNPLIPTLFLSAGNDRMVKLWEIQAEEVRLKDAAPASSTSSSTSSSSPSNSSSPVSSPTPTLVTSKEMRVGQIWAASWSRDTSSLLACGGDKGKVAVWDIREDKACMRRFGARENWTALPSEEELPTRAEKRTQRSAMRGHASLVDAHARKRGVDDDDENEDNSADEEMDSHEDDDSEED